VVNTHAFSVGYLLGSGMVVKLMPIRMNISRKYKFLFFHIPKCAGTSVARLGWEIGKTSPVFDPPYYGHIRAVETKFSLEKSGQADIWDSFFKWTIVRNPFDRLVSLYGYFNTMGPGPGENPTPYQAGNIPISKFVKALGSFKAFCQNLNTPPIKPNYHFFPQAYWLYYDSKCLAEFVGRYENLMEDYEKVKNRLGLTYEFPHRNPSKHKPYREYYVNDPELQSVVTAKYAVDFELFNYPKEVRNDG
jgi:chondroitin 4-sulfotransferase 11